MQYIRQIVYSFLRRAETYTKTDMVYIAKNSFWLTLGRGIAAGSSALLTIVLANTLTKEALGDYRFVLSLAGIIAAFSLTGMSAAIIRAVAQGKPGTFWLGMRTSIRWGVSILILGIGISAYYFINGNEKLGASVLFITFSTFIVQIASQYSAILSGNKDFRRDSLYTMITTLLYAGSMVAVSFLTHSLVVLILTYSVITAGAALFFLWRTTTVYPSVGPADPSAITYGKHLSVMGILGQISFQLDKVLMFHYFGAAQLALYSVAMAIPQQLRYLNKVLSTLMIPRMSTRSARELRSGLNHKALIIFIGALALVIAYIAAAPHIFRLILPNYVDAVWYSQMFSLIILFFPSMVYQNAITSQGKHKMLYIVQTVNPIVKIGSLFVLLPLYGIIGAFIAMLINEIIRLVIVWYYAMRMKDDANMTLEMP